MGQTDRQASRPDFEPSPRLCLCFILRLQWITTPFISYFRLNSPQSFVAIQFPVHIFGKVCAISSFLFKIYRRIRKSMLPNLQIPSFRCFTTFYNHLFLSPLGCPKRGQKSQYVKNGCDHRFSHMKLHICTNLQLLVIIFREMDNFDPLFTPESPLGPTSKFHIRQHRFSDCTVNFD